MKLATAIKLRNVLMNKFLIALLLPLTVLLIPLSHAAENYGASIKAFKAADETKPFFQNAYGYALFPTIGKGGFGIGGAHGKGQVYKGGKVSGRTSMTQLTIGLQAGGQAYSQVIFFQDKRAYDDFTSGDFEFGAQATAVAITASAQASAGSSGKTAGSSPGGSAGKQAKARYRKGMATFTYAKGGLMYEATLGGQKFSFEQSGKKK